MADAILALNAGSSSVKLALFEIGRDGGLTRAFAGQIEDIDTRPHFAAHDAAGKPLADQRWDGGQPAFEALLRYVLDFVDTHLGGDELCAVGHRVVHGGSALSGPARIDDTLLRELDALIPLAPLHEPHNIAPMRVIAALRPRLAQVACFDTAFHHTMPEIARRFALPREITDRGVRRYGFHGLSYAFIAGRLAEVAPALANGRVIVAHLGNGASLCAMRNGRSIDTTMAFTALDGLMMGTRCGAIDPGVLLYLQQALGMSVGAVEDLLYRKSGLLGVSGISSDMRALHRSEDPLAREAIALFTYRVAREAGALVSSLGGLDGFVFTAGIGEHDAAVRAEACERLAWLGIVIDGEANARGAALISRPESRVAIHVIPTDEEAMIARETLRTIRQG